MPSQTTLSRIRHCISKASFGQKSVCQVNSVGVNWSSSSVKLNAQVRLVLLPTFGMYSACTVDCLKIPGMCLNMLRSRRRILN